MPSIELLKRRKKLIFVIAGTFTILQFVIRKFNQRRKYFRRSKQSNFPIVFFLLFLSPVSSVIVWQERNERKNCSRNSSALMIFHYFYFSFSFPNRNSENFSLCVLIELRSFLLPLWWIKKFSYLRSVNHGQFFVLIVKTQISFETTKKIWTKKNKIKSRISLTWCNESRNGKRRIWSDHDDDSMKFNLNLCIVLSRREFLHSINDFFISYLKKRRERRESLFFWWEPR